MMPKRPGHNQAHGEGLAASEPDHGAAVRVARASDHVFMRQALAMGERHLGLTAPNPSVGAVLVDEAPGRVTILARGVTAPGGRPHAERLALDAAGPRARGATLFVTLEPCAHHGRTPPCAEAIMAAGVGRVVCAMQDPDPRVAGQGLAMLRRAGIDVVLGVMEQEARALHAGHVMRVTTGRPFLTLKLAATADGFAAPRKGARLMISGPIANAQTHLLRVRSDAIMVGIGTVLSDDPKLTCRLPGLESRSPTRVVFDTHLRTPLTAKIVTSAGQVATILVAGADAPQAVEAAFAKAGVEILRVRARAGGLDIVEALQALGRRGVTILMCEGGPTLANSLAAAGVLDELILVRSPSELGEPGIPAIGDGLRKLLSQKVFSPLESLEFGPDLWTRSARLTSCSPAS
jgi:diaminohydroxyphosphoribosylaminopyrimidine deaminase / 5-amino-6-(5-phosphoribosylamino)uracil reductase